MSSSNRSNKPNYLRGKHFGIPKSASNSEDSSANEDLWGIKRPPPKENVPSIAVTSAPPTATVGPAGTRSPAVSPRSVRSKPVKIELPIRHRAHSSRIKTPPEPVSARGDREGACFIGYEDPKIRVYEPHPFKNKLAQKERERSIARAAEEEANSPPPNPNTSNSTTPYTTMRDAMNESRMMAAQPVTSYMPSGHNSPAPVGKYYPPNYEKRHLKDNLSLSPSHASLSVKSDSQVPRYHPDPSHQRTNSEAQRMLQQYQRDMVTQASLGIKSTYRGADKTARSKVPAPSIGPHLRNLQQGYSASKPTSPRLAPLGSPGGPVTPMNLEDGPDNFFFSPKRIVPKREPPRDENRRTQSERRH